MSLRNRLSKLEAILAPAPANWPVVIAVRYGETEEAAYARHVEQFGPKPKLMRGGLLVVPETPRTEEEKIAARKRTEIRQAKLMGFARQRPQPVQAQ